MPLCCKGHCCNASSVPYASLLQGLPLQGFISALCLPVARPPALENVWSGLVCVLYPNREFASAAHSARPQTQSSAVVWSGLCFILNQARALELKAWAERRALYTHCLRMLQIFPEIWENSILPCRQTLPNSSNATSEILFVSSL